MKNTVKGVHVHGHKEETYKIGDYKNEDREVPMAFVQPRDGL